MNEETAFVYSQTVCAQIEMQGMVAENSYLEQQDQPPAYHKKHFDELIIKYGIGYNDVVKALWRK
jgi:hypothetical protein